MYEISEDRILKKLLILYRKNPIGLNTVFATAGSTQAEQKLAQARYKFMLAYLRLVKESGLGLETVFAE